MSKIEEAMKLIGPGCACEVNLGNILVLTGALKEAIEQHEAFRQEVSDAVESLCNTTFVYEEYLDMRDMLRRRFIITKPDPLVEVLKDADDMVRVPDAPSYPDAIRAALAKRGLEIREKSE